MGELVAWIIGWDLILEYGVSVAAVAVGWGQYLSDLLDSLFGFSLPEAIAAPPGDGGTVNLPAAFLVLAVAALLIAGVRKSARTNTIMVASSSRSSGSSSSSAFTAFNGDHFYDFTPNGFDGIVDGAALIFFAYIGFDAVSTGGGGGRNPQRDLPIGIIGALVIATIALHPRGPRGRRRAAGRRARRLRRPAREALSEGAGIGWAADVISFGALIAITSVVLTVLFGQTRIAFSMSRDGLLPRALARTSRDAPARPCGSRSSSPSRSRSLAAFAPLSEIAKLVNIGTLFAFVLVNAGVIWLRRTKPDLDRGYRVPFVPVVPLIGIALCVYLMTKLDGETWLRFGAWLVLGVRHLRRSTATGTRACASAAAPDVAL